MNENSVDNAESVLEHMYELKKTPEGYTVAQCSRCGYWLWETFHGIPPCVSAHNDDVVPEDQCKHCQGTGKTKSYYRGDTMLCSFCGGTGKRQSDGEICPHPIDESAWLSDDVFMCCACGQKFIANDPEITDEEVRH